MIFLFSATALANPLKKIVVFGDSLSDIGNLYEYTQHQIPNSPPYYKGHFSNGPIWVEFLAQSYFPSEPEKHLLDYAFGGAGIVKEEDDDGIIFTLKREIESYLAAHDDKASDDNLYVVWIGANNYLAEVENIEDTLNLVNTGIKKGILKLIDKGATHILVIGLPDLGKSPFARIMSVEKEVSSFCSQHNQRLEKTLSELQEQKPNVNILYFDVRKFVDLLLASPESYGLQNITDTCYDIPADLIKNSRSMLRMTHHLVPKVGMDQCAGYLFFDPVHPTSLAHKWFSEQIRLMLDEHGFTAAG